MSHCDFQPSQSRILVVGRREVISGIPHICENCVSRLEAVRRCSRGAVTVLGKVRMEQRTCLDPARRSRHGAANVHKLNNETPKFSGFLSSHGTSAGEFPRLEGNGLACQFFETSELTNSTKST
jgi:hypothetical protein